MNFREKIIAKPILYALLACLFTGGLSLAFMASPHKLSTQTKPVAPELTAHEWGTFTSIAGNDGHAVEWAPLTSFDLPRFVEHIGYAELKSGLRGTVRMETPVIYFYSPNDLTLSVQVSFSKGLITEWYPHASRVAPTGHLTSTSLNGNHADGTISWDSVHVEPGLAAELPREDTDNHYYAARETSASTVRVQNPKGDQQEKFLFYRGVSGVPLPLSANVTAEGDLRVRNLAQEEIPALVLFERRGEKIGYRISNGLEHEATLKPPELNASLESLYNDIEQVLMARGLYRDEAHAMIRTWQNSWFEEGSRLFYIVPPSFVDAILPLTINPAPARTVRVFVGRLELVTPATQRAIETALASHDRTTLIKYFRFLDPILKTMTENNPVKEKKFSELLSTTWNSEVAQTR